MSSESTGTIQETGWTIEVKANPKIREFGSSSTLSTGYHLLQVRAAHLYTDPNTSPGIDLHANCQASQAEGPRGPIDTCKGMDIRLDRLWLSWTPTQRDKAIARMAASDKFKEHKAIEDALEREERVFKSLLIAMGHNPEAVRALEATLSPAAFADQQGVGLTFLVWYEKGVWDNDEKKWGKRPIWNFVAKDKAEALLAGKSGQELLNEEYRAGARATVALPPAAGIGTGAPALGMPATGKAPALGMPAVAAPHPANGQVVGGGLLGLN